MEKKCTVVIKDLLEAGAHFGHQTSRWNPKMKRFIYGEKNGIHVIDLAKTLSQLQNACTIVESMVENHKSILFVGTKKAAKTIVREETERAGEFYVCERWLGGMLTNLTTIRRSIKKMEQYEKRIASGGEGLTKKELSLLSKQQEKLEKNLSGIRAMRKPPGLLVIIDVSQEDLAVAEAKKLGIPVMALVDTNCNPDQVDYVIPCNDDAQRSIKVVLQALVDTIVAKKNEIRLTSQEDEAEEKGEMEAAFQQIPKKRGKKSDKREEQ